MVRAVIRPKDPDRARVLRADAMLAAVAAALGLLVGTVAEMDVRPMDGVGVLLLATSAVPLVWRRSRPMTVLLAHFAVVSPFHALNYAHMATFGTTAIALYSVAVAGPVRRTLFVKVGVVVAVAVMWAMRGSEVGVEILRTSGWILAALVAGEAMRLHRQNLEAMRERAERAERTREQEAARRVAEERLRIARDLHDLLAHSITLIGVRASVASHILIADPERLDRRAVSEALDGISETCRDARAELRTTLQVLRGDEPGDGDRERERGRQPHAPLPDLSGIPDLVRAAEEAGAKVTLTLDVPRPLPSVAGAAAYRIVQEALTNAVRHAGPDVGVEVVVRHEGPTLRLSITDTGPAAPAAGVGAGAGARSGTGAGGPAGAATASDAPPAVPPVEAPPKALPGYGITGMRERARSMGGTLRAQPRADGPGFTVTAELPVPAEEIQ